MRVYWLIFVMLLTAQSVYAGQWHQSFGVGIINVNDAVKELHRQNLQAEAKDDAGFRANLRWAYFYHPYYQYDNGFALGLGVASPAAIHTNEELALFVNIPTHVDVRYVFSVGEKFDLFLRAGMRYNLAFGDYVESSKPGAIAGLGFQVKISEKAKVGLEFVDDSSEIEFKDVANNRKESINLNQSTLSVIFVF